MAHVTLFAAIRRDVKNDVEFIEVDTLEWTPEAATANIVKLMSETPETMKTHQLVRIAEVLITEVNPPEGK